jgi:hypothetical protein
MAIGKKGFQKGRSGNPGGRPKAEEDIQRFKLVTLQDFMTHLTKYGALNRQEIAQEIARPEATMFELVVGNIVAGAAKGDKNARQVLLERLWGKVKEQMEYSAGSNTQVIVQLPPKDEE